MDVLIDQICQEVSAVYDDTKNDFEESQTLAEEAGLFDAPLLISTGSYLWGERTSHGYVNYYSKDLVPNNDSSRVESFENSVLG